MPKAGRNDPCPCGSGKKYKMCCLPGEKVEPSAVARILEMDERLVADMLRFGIERFGRDFDPVGTFEDKLGGDSRDVSVYMPWAVYHCEVEGNPVVDHFLDARRRSLTAVERGWLEAQRVTGFSVWLVDAIEDSGSVRLLDLLTRRFRTVPQAEGLQAMAADTVLFARVVDHGEVPVLASRYPRTVTAADGKQAAARLRGAWDEGDGPVLPGWLADEQLAGHLVTAWMDLLDGNPDLPSLPERERDPDEADEDGEVEEPEDEAPTFASDRYLPTTFPMDRDAISAALNSIPGITSMSEDERGNEVWHLSGREEDGMRPLLGAMELSAEMVIVLSPSPEALDRTRRLIEAKAGGVLRHHDRKLMAHEDLLRTGEREDEGDAMVHSPEEARRFREHKAAYYEGWLEAPHPYLDGLTPLAALEVRRLRDHIHGIFKDMEIREQRVPPDARVDLSSLRRRLGLEEESEE